MIPDDFSDKDHVRMTQEIVGTIGRQLSSAFVELRNKLVENGLRPDLATTVIFNATIQSMSELVLIVSGTELGHGTMDWHKAKFEISEKIGDLAHSFVVKYGTNPIMKVKRDPPWKEAEDGQHPDV